MLMLISALLLPSSSLKSSLLRSLVAPLTLSALFTACRSGSSGNPPPAGSRVADFTLDEYQAPAGGPAWDKVQVLMERATPTANKIDRSFAKSDFQGGKAGDVSLKVEYGSYTIDLLYSDKDKKVVYRTCAAERSKKYEINQPNFKAKIKVCRVNSNGGEGTEGGEVTFQPSANVELSPTFSEETSTAGGDEILPPPPSPGKETLEPKKPAAGSDDCRLPVFGR